MDGYGQCWVVVQRVLTNYAEIIGYLLFPSEWGQVVADSNPVAPTKYFLVKPPSCLSGPKRFFSFSTGCCCKIPSSHQSESNWQPQTFFCLTPTSSSTVWRKRSVGYSEEKGRGQVFSWLLSVERHLDMRQN